MADEEQQDETTPDQPSAEQAGAESEPETPPEPGGDKGSGSSAGEAAAEDAAGTEGSDSSSGDAAAESKAADQAPGADLEPIALEPERELSAEERAAAEADEEERAAAEVDEDDGAADEPLARKAIKLDPATRVQATGKRKTAIARVVVRSGSGAFEINSRELNDYFPRHQHRTMALQPLVTAGYESTVDVKVRVHGGGVGGQAGAVRHGIARALTEIDPELRGELKRRGFLTRDAREKERRKAGLKKARKRPQFSKR
jgi:small subunit ribosomal protein S9